MAKKIQRNTPVQSRTVGSSGGGGAAAGSKVIGGRIRGQLVTDFTVQLATLSEAGIPVVRALTILEGQTKPGPFKALLAEITEDVSGGAPLSEAMGKHPRCFDELFSAMVRAGESAGILDRILVRLAAFREKAAEIQSKIVNAMIYPAILTVVATGIVSAVIVFVIPRFQEIFESFDVTLPGSTQFLLDVSEIATQRWYLVFGVPAAMVLLHMFMITRSKPYRFRIHGLMLKLPLAGGLMRQSLIARFSRTFGTLVEAGVPHLDALGIVRDATANMVLAQGIEDIRRTVREGESIARTMGETGLFDDIVTNMVDVGEETGELDRMLLKVADAYERQLDRRIDALFKFLEPVLLLVMAVVVGFIVVALFMPLLEIMNSINSSS
ncbi:MAG: type II secretion system F family protein [Planctomycetota bacterium]|nr:type II secretion system F family protein [Planctomycetota bacterium]